MKRIWRRMLVLGLAASLILAVIAYADIFLLDFTGYDWTVGGDLDDPGTCYEAIGFVPSANPDLNFDYAANEYTFHLEDACFVDADTVGMLVIYHYGPNGPLPTKFSVYCDARVGGTAGDYGTNPPNGSVPATFVDGDCVLSGDFTELLTFVIDLNTGDGSIQGVLEWNGGTKLGSIPLGSRTMSLVLAGANYDPVDGPEGYRWQITGTIDTKEPLPVESTSWGDVKTRFAGGR